MQNDKKFMFSKLPNRPEPSQISDSVSKKYLTARLTSNGFDTAQHTVWETSAYSCYWVLILEPILLNFLINVLATLTSEGAFIMDLQIYWAPNLCGFRGSKVWFNSLKKANFFLSQEWFIPTRLILPEVDRSFFLLPLQKPWSLAYYECMWSKNK